MEKYGTPRLGRMKPDETGHPNCYWVSRVNLDKRKARSFMDCEYLRSDGTWQYGMDTCDQGSGGTYFKTLDDVIRCLVEFEIDVTSREQIQR